MTEQSKKKKKIEYRAFSNSIRLEGLPEEDRENRRDSTPMGKKFCRCVPSPVKKI